MTVKCLIIQCCFLLVCARHTQDFWLCSWHFSYTSNRHALKVYMQPYFCTWILLSEPIYLVCSVFLLHTYPCHTFTLSQHAHTLLVYHWSKTAGNGEKIVVLLRNDLVHGTHIFMWPSKQPPERTAYQAARRQSAEKHTTGGSCEPQVFGSVHHI